MFLLATHASTGTRSVRAPSPVSSRARPARSLAALRVSVPYPLWFRSPWPFIALCSHVRPPQSSAAGVPQQLPQTRRLEAEETRFLTLRSLQAQAQVPAGLQLPGGASSPLFSVQWLPASAWAPRPAAASPHRRLILPRVFIPAFRFPFLQGYQPY